MKKTISAKRVLNELLAEYNAQSVASNYAKAKGDYTTRDQCQAAMDSLCDVINGLDFKEGTDYESSKVNKTIGDVSFFYWRREAIA